MSIRTSRRKTLTEPTSVDHHTASAIALGVHIVNSKPMLWNDFKEATERLIKDLHLSRKWLGISYPKIQDDDESHLRLGVVATASVQGGAIKGFLKRLYKSGVEVALVCHDNTEHEWALVRVSKGGFEELSAIGRFDITKVDTLVSLLLSQAPTSESLSVERYTELPADPHIELCGEPSRGFFSLAHIRYAERRRAALAAVASSTKPNTPQT